MKIGIHHNVGSFSERWIEYCDKKHIPYKIVNCYDSTIIQQLEDCDALMWHHHHLNYKDLLFAKQLLFSLEQSGKKIFPDFNTGWYFDDKVGQKYMLESIGAPLIPSYIFYSKKEALDWVKKTSFPKVFKLRCGAGAASVRLIQNSTDAKSFVNKAFDRGFPKFNKIGILKEYLWKCQQKGKNKFISVLKGFARLVIPIQSTKMYPREKGYVYFQDFIANNNYDIRVIVIGLRAFAIKRLTREGDFRASGSGRIIYDKNEMPEQCVQMAFDINKLIKSQCIGYDFVFDKMNQPLLAEISYGFTTHVYDPCPGYWDSDLVWHEGKFNPQIWIIENLVMA